MELKTVTGTGAMAQKEHGSYFHSTQVQFPAPIPGGSQLPLWLQGTQHLWPSCMLVLICSFPHTEAHTDMKLEKKKKRLVTTQLSKSPGLGDWCSVRRLTREATQILNHQLTKQEAGSIILKASWSYLACCCNRLRSVHISWVVSFWLSSTAEEMRGTGGLTGCRTRGGWGASCFRKLLRTLSLAGRKATVTQ